MSFRLERVDNARRRADFFRVKWHIYRDDPAAALPLRRMEWSLLDPAIHPFYQHARREVWVAYDARRPVGRIAAIIDDLHRSHYQDRMGFFGFFESPDDPACARTLLDTARQWLIEQGCDAIRGPVNPSMKGEFGVLVEGHAFPPFIMMGHTPAYYDRLFQGEGLAVVKRFYAYLLDWSEGGQQTLKNLDKLRAVSARILRRFPQLSIRAATPHNLEPLLREINRIGNTIRSRGWGFVPLTDAELDYMVQQLRRVIQPRTVIAAYWEDRLVGYNVSIPNVNWALRRARGRWDWWRIPQLLYWLPRTPQVRLIAVGVDPEYRAKGIATVLTKEMVELGSQFEKWEFGWIAEDNLASIAALERAVPMNRYKCYQLYQAPL